MDYEYFDTSMMKCIIQLEKEVNISCVYMDPNILVAQLE